MADVTLRPPRDEEAPAISEFCLRSKAVWGYDAAFLEACRAELTVTPAHFARDACRVAEIGGVITGFAQLRVIGTAADLVMLFVAPDGLRAGVGRTLFRWAAETARDAGAAALSVESDPGAAGFYRRMGMVEDGVVPSGSIPGRVVPRLILAL
jgi:GNAT superfamily N-acetyltransferase